MATPALRVVTEPLDVPEFSVRYFWVTSADGTRIRAWTNDADGPTVLLCNGLGTNPYCWPALMRSDCGVRVISWNQRGTGGSDRPGDRDRVGIDAFVEDAIAVMDACGVESAPAMGWSIGVNTAFELAVRHPARVEAIFAVAGMPGGTFSSMLAPLGVPKFLREPIIVNACRVVSAVGAPVGLVQRYLRIGSAALWLISHSGFMFPLADPVIGQKAVAEFVTTPLDWYAHLAVRTSQHQLVDLSVIDVPTTVISAKWDILASAEEWRELAEDLRDCEVIEYDASHFVQMERPEEVHADLLDLLERVGAR